MVFPGRTTTTIPSDLSIPNARETGQTEAARKAKVEKVMEHSQQHRTDVAEQRHVRPRITAIAGGAATLIAMGAVIAGCGNGGNQAPSTTTTTTATTTSSTTTPVSPVSPTEKSINPTGGNLFTPPVLAPPAPTEPPGVHRNNK